MSNLPDSMSVELLKGHGGLADIDYIGHGRDGGYAEYCSVPAENAYRLDNDMSDAELATFCCAYLTAEHMLNRADVQAGERVLITGAFAGAMVELDLRTIYLKHLQIHGSSQGTRGTFQDLIGYIREGRLKPNLYATYPLSEFQRAQRNFMNKQYIGKLVVMPDRFYQETRL